MSDNVSKAKIIDRNKLLLVMDILSSFKGDRFFAVNGGEVKIYYL